MPKPHDGITRSECVVQLMLSGEPVKIEEFKTDFEKRNCENVFYKLSYYILQAKHKGAIIKAHRESRRVVSYQLMNYKQFDMNGKYIKPGQLIKEKENAIG